MWRKTAHLSTNRQIKENSYIGTKTAQKQPKKTQKLPKTSQMGGFLPHWRFSKLYNS